MAEIAFNQVRPAGEGLVYTLLGGLPALLLLVLPRVLSAGTWPPWADFVLDRERVTARARGRASVPRARAGGPSSRGCPRETAGVELAVELAPGDPSVARIPGHRATALPFTLWAVLDALGLLAGALALAGVWLFVTGSRRT